MENQISGIGEEFLVPAERARLVGLCARISGNYDIAEDLAQETLLVAWRESQKLRDPGKRAQWIAGIARHVCLRWLRRYGRDQAHHIELKSGMEDETAGLMSELVTDDFDLEVELERKELVDLLERALSLLPAETRAVLIKRYVEESPLSEIAAQLGINASAIAMRLQRGKLALRKVLTSDMQSEIGLYDSAATADTWERTSLWCHICGKHHLLGQKQLTQGKLYLKCPTCSPGKDQVVSKNESLLLLRSVKGYKPAYSRLVAWCNDYYRGGLRNGFVKCVTCGRQGPMKISRVDEIPELLRWNEESPKWVWQQQSERLVNGICPHCMGLSCISLEGLVLALPEGQAFLRAHPRIRWLPYRSIEFAGRPAIVTSFESVLDSARFDAISDYETYEVLRIYGGEK